MKVGFDGQHRDKQNRYESDGNGITPGPDSFRPLQTRERYTGTR